MERRRFLSTLAVGAGALLGAALSVPILGQVLSPLRKAARGGFDWFPIGALGDFPEGPPKRVAFPVTTQDGWTSRTDQQSAWVRREGSQVTVFTAICPHLGCSVQWKPTRACFACPCHDSEFSPDGTRRKGPARRGLDALPSRIRDGQVEVRWEEYAAGSEARTPLYGGPAGEKDKAG